MPEPAEFDDLKRELREASADHPKAGEVLGHVDGYLGDEGGGDEARTGLIQTLSDAVYHFEAEHPRLTAAVQRVIDSLTAAGI